MANEIKSSVNEEKNIGDAVVDRETRQGFTPGPWRVSGTMTGKRQHQVWSGTARIALVELQNVGTEAAEANARLIAAAPAMYGLLKATQAYIETQENETMPDEMAALWNRISEVVTPISDRRTDGQASETRSE